MLLSLKREIPGILIDEVCHGFVCDLRSVHGHTRIISCLRFEVLPCDVHLLIRYVAWYPDHLPSSSWISHGLDGAAAHRVESLWRCS